MTASPPSGPGCVPDRAAGPPSYDCEDSGLLAALLDGMDAALCAFDAEGVVTHWNREAERILGWSAEDAVGRRGFAGWAVRTADACEVEDRLLGAMKATGRQVHEFALLTKDGGRVLVRTQSAGVRAADGTPTGVYCAFSEVHAQIGLERSIALSEALLEDAAWGVVLVDADLRPAVANRHAAQAFRAGRAAVLGRPLGELLSQGAQELESALQHVLAEGAPPAPSELWVTLRPSPDRGDGVGERRCWRSGFVRLASPLAEEPVPLGVGWFFQDVTETRQLEQESALLRFRGNQLHRACLAAADCEDPMEAVTVQLDFALAGFADHVLLDVLLPQPGGTAVGGRDPGGTAGGTPPPGLVPGGHPAPSPRLERAAATPAAPGGPCTAAEPSGIPVPYAEGHPALQAVERAGPVRASAGGAGGPGAAGVPAAVPAEWARARQWPEDSVHALCVVLRSRGRTLGVVTFLRNGSRAAFERQDAVYAEGVAVRTAASLDLAGRLS